LQALGIRKKSGRAAMHKGAHLLMNEEIDEIGVCLRIRHEAKHPNQAYPKT
jgi:hypothetical protein